MGEIIRLNDQEINLIRKNCEDESESIGNWK